MNLGDDFARGAGNGPDSSEQLNSRELPGTSDLDDELNRIVARGKKGNEVTRLQSNGVTEAEDPSVESLNPRIVIAKLQRDIYEDAHLLVVVATHGGFYVLWVGIMILVHRLVSLMGHLSPPYSVIPLIAELVVQFGVLFVIANQTWDFAMDFTAHSREKRRRRTRRRRGRMR